MVKDIKAVFDIIFTYSSMNMEVKEREAWGEGTGVLDEAEEDATGE